MTRHSLLGAALILLGVLACESRSANDERAPAVGDASAITAYTDTLAIRRRVDSIFELAGTRPRGFRIFARPADGAKLVAVKDSLSWPPTVETSFTILFDADSAVLLHVEVPSSESGDWHMESEHVFDSQGRTVFHRAHVSGFGSECAEIVRETVRTFFNPATGAAIARTTEVTDADGKPIADLSRCYLRGSSVPGPKRSVTDLAMP